MAIITVNQLQIGDRLDKDVTTKRKNALLMKGTVISQREIDILEAFTIPKVSIEVRSGIEATAVEEEELETDTVMPALTSFHKSYEQMLALLKKSYHDANSGFPLDIIEIRSVLIQLIENVNEYNVLTFKPLNFELEAFYYHKSIMVSLTSLIIAIQIKLPSKDHVPVALAGLLHDIGNCKIDPLVLNKRGKLTNEEYEQVKRHPIIGYNMLKNVTGINEGVKLAAIQHHEREDGSGYPLGVKSDKIHIYAKIVAIADVFHAMTTQRVYNGPMSPYLVLEQINQDAFGKLDPNIVRSFIQKITQFHIGTKVKLNDNRIGEIVFSEADNPTRPWVNVNGAIINLSTNRNYHIQEVIE